VQHALAGIRIAVCVLIFKATLKMAKSGIKDVFGILLFCAVLVASYFSIVPTIAIIIISAAAGVLVKLVQTKKKVS
jgi:chromate transporter